MLSSEFFVMQKWQRKMAMSDSWRPKMRNFAEVGLMVIY